MAHSIENVKEKEKYILKTERHGKNEMTTKRVESHSHSQRHFVCVWRTVCMRATFTAATTAFHVTENQIKSCPFLPSSFAKVVMFGFVAFLSWHSDKCEMNARELFRHTWPRFHFITSSVYALSAQALNFIGIGLFVSLGFRFRFFLLFERFSWKNKSVSVCSYLVAENRYDLRGAFTLTQTTTRWSNLFDADSVRFAKLYKLDDNKIRYARLPADCALISHHSTINLIFVFAFRVVRLVLYDSSSSSIITWCLCDISETGDTTIFH